MINIWDSLLTLSCGLRWITVALPLIMAFWMEHKGSFSMTSLNRSSQNLELADFKPSFTFKLSLGN